MKWVQKAEDAGKKHTATHDAGALWIIPLFVLVYGLTVGILGLNGVLDDNQMKDADWNRFAATTMCLLLCCLLYSFRKSIGVPLNEGQIFICILWDCLFNDYDVLNTGILLTLAVYGFTTAFYVLPFILVFESIRLNKTLRNLAAVLVKTGEQFALVLCMFALMSFLFTTFAFNEFGLSEFSVEQGDCKNLGQCTLMAIYAGLNHKGREVPLYDWLTGYRDDFDGLTRVPIGEADQVGTRYMFDVTSIIVTEIMIYSIIVGVITTTFMASKNKNEQRTKTMEDTCFITNVTRDQANEHRIDFERLKEVFDPMIYIQYVFYLQQKDTSTFNGIESMIWTKYTQMDTSWVPTQSHVVLDQFKSEKSDLEVGLERVERES